ncbi:dTDP-4-dehydrorhamnose 3,5-epimerase family protein [Angustibacter luteus]|uniref:dTDP-4-dehydrorhamnose 3,5-epimerase family protein n=1 Tax=Angustibacter luteus TaxID=658456 RepID=A0ABW1JFS8_9ACTN
MQITPLTIEGAWKIVPRQHSDDRGVFLEWFAEAAFAEATGQRLNLAQANISTSSAGVVRGIHFAQLPPSQAKYVTCPSGAVLDVVVDIRVGSPTFGQYETVVLDDVERAALYLSEGLGHGYMALRDGSVFAYLCSAPYAPGREHGVSPMCPELAIEWPTTAPDGTALTPLMSPKDLAAPTLSQAREQGLLPTYAQVQDFRATLRR